MISEERLRLAAQEAGRAIADSLPEPEDCEAEFSPSFERKMKKVIWLADHRGLCLGLRRAACFFLALLLSGGVFLTVNAEARELIFGWISQRVEDAQHYFFTGSDAGERANVAYHLAELPEGYQLEERYETETHIDISYVNLETNHYLSFGYLLRATETSSTELFLETEGMEEKQVLIQGAAAECYLDKTGEIANVITWVDQETDTLLYISGYLSQTELVQMAEQVVREGI